MNGNYHSGTYRALPEPMRSYYRPMIAFPAALVAVLNCANTQTTDPAGDRRVIRTMEATWEAQSPRGTFTLTLCEDKAAVQTWRASRSKCDVAHVMASDNTESVDVGGGVGCGGCPMQIVAYFAARATGPNRQAVETTSFLTFRDSSLYDFPYWLNSRSDNRPTDEIVGTVIDADQIVVTTLNLEGVAQATPAAERSPGDTSPAGGAEDANDAVDTVQADDADTSDAMFLDASPWESPALTETEAPDASVPSRAVVRSNAQLTFHRRDGEGCP